MTTPSISVRTRRSGAAAAALLPALAAGCEDAAGPQESTPLMITEVRVTPTALVLEIGDSVGVTARAFDARGREVPGRAVSWSSSAPAVVSVDTAGVARALSPGHAEVIATIEGRSGAATLTVPTPEPVADVLEISARVHVSALRMEHMSPRPRAGARLGSDERPSQRADQR